VVSADIYRRKKDLKIVTAHESIFYADVKPNSLLDRQSLTCTYCVNNCRDCGSVYVIDDVMNTVR